MDELPGARSQKLHVFERAMDAVSKQAKSTVAGQMSLFGGDEAIQAPRPPMPPLREFDMRMRLQMEKEVTGVYISGHPLDEYRDRLSRMEVNSRFLRTLVEESEDGGLSCDQKTVTMGGIIAERKLKAVKSGNLMAFVQLEDLYGVTEVLVFPRVYDRVSQLLTQDTPVLMTGKLSIREEEAPKLLLDRVEPLNGGGEAPQPPRAAGEKRLYLKFSQDQWQQVVEILQKTPGATPVVFCVEGQKARLTPRAYWVDAGGYDFFQLANLLGEKNVVYK